VRWYKISLHFNRWAHVQHLILVHVDWGLVFLKFSFAEDDVNKVFNEGDTLHK
jgi:hypothetical protein